MGAQQHGCGPHEEAEGTCVPQISHSYPSAGGCSSSSRCVPGFGGPRTTQGSVITPAPSNAIPSLSRLVDKGAHSSAHPSHHCRLPQKTEKRRGILPGIAEKKRSFLVVATMPARDPRAATPLEGSPVAKDQNGRNTTQKLQSGANPSGESRPHLPLSCLLRVRQEVLYGEGSGPSPDPRGFCV